MNRPLTTATSTDNPAWQGLTFRPLHERDLPQAWELSQQVRWPHRLEDWQFAHALGQGAAVCEGEQLVGVAIHWDYTSCATLGLIIVADSHRQRGLGSRLVADALAAITAPAVALHATPDGAGVYARQGFVTTGQLCQHQGVAAAISAPLPAGAALRPATLADLDVLSDLDQRACGMARRRLLQAVLQHGQCVVLQQQGQPQGFAMLRRFGRGEVIGPVVAADADAARALIAHWLGVCAGRFVRIDVPTDAGLADWLAEAGLVAVDTCARMVRGFAPVAGKGGDGSVRTYALVSQALF